MLTQHSYSFLRILQDRDGLVVNGPVAVLIILVIVVPCLAASPIGATTSPFTNIS